MQGHGGIQHQLSFAETFSTSSTSGPNNKVVEEDDRHDPPTILASEVIALADKALAAKNCSLISVEKAVGGLCEAYAQLEDQREVLQHISKRSVDRDRIKKLAAEYAASDLASTQSRLEEELREALSPPYIWLFKKIGQLRGGVKFLVDLRAQLIPMTRLPDMDSETSASLKTMNAQLRQLLAHWFSVGFLELEQVTWGSPCAMLQKVADYEAVHPMRNWTDLKSRVGLYRRCFVYTHRSMPGEPIVVLHVALTKGIPEKISTVVRHHRMVKRFSVDSYNSPAEMVQVAGGGSGEDASTCDSAIFYSITSTQTGLQGIELGTYLIKQAVKRLKEELPSIMHFCTLSPMPGFRSWLLTAIKLRDEDGGRKRLFTDTELASFGQALGCGPEQVLDAVADSLRTNSWAADAELAELFETPLMRLCARYLYLEKHRNQGRHSPILTNFPAAPLYPKIVICLYILYKKMLPCIYLNHKYGKLHPRQSIRWPTST
jgi:malonyl-CoA decarboxylase